MTENAHQKILDEAKDAIKRDIEQYLPGDQIAVLPRYVDRSLPNAVDNPGVELGFVRRHAIRSRTVHVVLWEVGRPGYLSRELAVDERDVIAHKSVNQVIIISWLQKNEMSDKD